MRNELEKKEKRHFEKVEKRGVLGAIMSPPKKK